MSCWPAMLKCPPGLIARIAALAQQPDADGPKYAQGWLPTTQPRFGARAKTQRPVQF